MSEDVQPSNVDNSTKPVTLADMEAQWEEQLKEAAGKRTRRSRGSKSGENPISAFMVATFLDDEYFQGWSDDELAKKDAGLQELGEVIRDRLLLMCDVQGISLTSLYLVLHDRDWNMVWDDVDNEYVQELKKSHIHIFGEFASRSDGATVAQIAMALGFDEHMVEKPKRGRYAVENMKAYMMHAKDEEKAQYSPDEVITLIGEDYKNVWKMNRLSWEKGRAAKAKKETKIDVDWLYDQIVDGNVTRSQVNLTDSYFTVWSRYRAQLEIAFDVYAERQAYRTIKALENGEFRVTPIMIVGQSGAGKTMFAHKVCRALVEWSVSKYGKAWRVCQTAASNPMDEYAGEEILVMDDARGATMTASDWLKLLDNHYSSPSSARYHNKQPAVRVILITSTKEPLEFFYYCKQMGGGDRSEALDQFFRRLTQLVYVLHPDDYGHQNIQLLEPVKGERYVGLLESGEQDVTTAELAERGIDFKKTKKVPGLTYRFQHKAHEGYPEGTPLVYTAEAAIAELLELIEKNNSLREQAEVIEIKDGDTDGK